MADPGNDRLDPDRLLQTLEQAQSDARRGRLRIYFGACAGVGKTYAMLAAARAQAAQGVDVVAGLVETHGRADTAALLDTLPALPLQTLDFQGRRLREFDLQAAVARRPRLLLLDELAHTNAPGARHAKRWQDIEELLAAGIDVWTTLNVQHLESLNEAVGGITGVRVRETVPDSVFDAADEIILVDLSADELLRRLREGRVYVPEQARHASRHFFRKGNLIALRELALRRTAEHVDDDVRAYRHERAIEPVWRTREAVVACIDADPHAEHVLRSAHRLAQQLDCEWHAITIEAPRVAPLPRAGRARLDQALALAETLGAHVETVAGTDMVDAATRYMRRHNITKAVVGRDAWRRRGLSGLLDAALTPGRLLRRRSFADALASACPEADIVRVGAPSAATA
ncbi:two-component sensor histidine kinase, partial [Bordetella parapertussis]|nr:two-component sensor histidine kinase [Bordetella parapertussis]